MLYIKTALEKIIQKISRLYGAIEIRLVLNKMTNLFKIYYICILYYVSHKFISLSVKYINYYYYLQNNLFHKNN